MRRTRPQRAKNHARGEQGHARIRQRDLNYHRERDQGRNEEEEEGKEDEHELQDTQEAPYFGDLPGKVRSQHFRIGSVNLNNLATVIDDDKHAKLFTAINTYGIDIMLMQEVGVDWTAIPRKDGWRARVCESLEITQTKSYMGYNKQAIAKEGKQWGGTGVMSYGKISHFSNGAGQDKAKLGRWSWARYRGKDGIMLRCVSIYRPCDSNGEKTVNAQHKAYLQANNDDRPPRQAFLEDLESELQEWLQAGDQVLIAGDINSHIFSAKIEELFERHNMTNLIFDRHGKENAPTTYYLTQGSRIVDGMWGTPGLAIQRGGYLEPGDFPGNHSLLWADISYTNALGHNPPLPQTPQARRLQLWNTRCTKKYLDQYEQYAHQRKLRNRQGRLAKHVRQQPYGTPLTGRAALEANAIDDLTGKSMRQAEHKCRKLKMGNVAFSEATEMPKKIIAFWEIAIKRRKGLPISPQHWQRKKDDAGIKDATQHLSIAQMEANVREGKKAYGKAKKNHKEERVKFLDTLKPKDRDRLKRNEVARENARMTRMVTGKNESKSVTMCQVDGQEYTTKTEIEDVFKDINYAKIQASVDTPFLQEPLVSEFGYMANTPAATEVLQGTYTPPPNTDEHARILLRALQTPQEISDNVGNFTPNRHITTEAHIQGWKKAKEKTSAGVSGRHFGMYKAHIQRPELAELDASMRSVAYSTGFSYNRWKKGADVQLLKRSQDFRADKQRTILLLEADYNMNNKVIGKDAMRAGERAKVFTGDNYGGKKGGRANEIAMNGRLVTDSIWARRGRAVLMSNDAKGCYDRIAHVVVKLALQRLGVPKPALDSMIETIQEMDHYIRTAFGDSETPYGKKPEDPPPQGILQGNGAGPAGWFAISTLLIDAMKQAGYGYHDWTLIRNRAFHISTLAFVDDTDLIHVNNDPRVTTAQLIEEAQAALTLWEGLIRASGGALAPEKSYWYLIEVVRKNGKWGYSTAASSPGTLHLNNGTYEVKRKNVNQPAEALGLHVSPDGQMKHELRYLKGKIDIWRDSIRTKRLKPSEAWYCFNSTIMKTIEYPLAATTFTRKQVDKLMSPLLRTILPITRIQRNMPRKLVYGTLRARGLDIKDPYITQLIYHLQSIMRHQQRDLPSRQLHEENMDNVQLHVGSELPFWEISFDQYGVLAPTGWMKNTWEALAGTPLTIKGEEISIPTQRQNDQHLIDAFVFQGYQGQALIDLNDCRLHLQATTLADLCTIDGKEITVDAWEGRFNPQRRRQDWIKTYRPGPNKWTQWQQALRDLFLQPHSLHKRLNQPLGQWTRGRNNAWRWWLHQPTDMLYSHNDDNTWSSWTRQIAATNNDRKYTNTTLVPTINVPTDLHHTQVRHLPTSHWGHTSRRSGTTGQEHHKLQYKHCPTA